MSGTLINKHALDTRAAFIISRMRLARRTSVVVVVFSKYTSDSHQLRKIEQYFCHIRELLYRVHNLDAVAKRLVESITPQRSQRKDTRGGLLPTSGELPILGFRFPYVGNLDRSLQRLLVQLPQPRHHVLLLARLLFSWRALRTRWQKRFQRRIG